jgi:plasmid maintenance system antidote protein VapI
MAKDMHEPTDSGALNPAAIEIAQLARMLGLPEKTLRDHVEAGAPVNADGTLNLVHFAAWLNLPSADRDAHAH